ncbi:hypothetical protein HMI54_003006 [Coelomomyces lativittatus]|nr:hypothetical protein HMI54_003006 [Coelomomyces lativittatus]
METALQQLNFNSDQEDKTLSLNTIIEDDIAFENDLIRNPYTTRPWLRYLDHKLGYLDRIPESHYIILFERAVKTLPGSYRLWKHYLEWCKTRIRKMKGLEKDLEATRITGAFKRALLILHKKSQFVTCLRIAY